MDYHVLKLGAEPYTFIVAFTGTMGIIGLSIVIRYIAFLKRIFVFFGRHSLFIMETHEYFMIKTLLSIMLIFFPILKKNWLVIEFICLIGIEIILIYILEPIINKIAKNMERNMLKIFGLNTN